MKYYSTLGVLMLLLLTSCYTKEQRLKRQIETHLRRMREAREKDSLYKLQHGIKDTVHHRIEPLKP
jgi:hypothetical protein